MAKAKEEKLNYKLELQKLKNEGPRALYLLWGKEDYLREQYLTQLKSVCIPEGESGFNYRRFDGPEIGAVQLRQAIDSVPFLSERSFVELRDLDINRLKESQEIQLVLSDIPEYCTVCFVQNAEYEPDGRLKLIASHGKRIDFEAAQRLIFISGDLMNRLIPEIEKIAAYAPGDTVSVREVEAVAHHIPEAQVFELTDQLAKKQLNAAMNTLAELFAENEYDPIYLLAVLGSQMRRLYAARLAIEKGLGSKYVAECCSIKYDFLVGKLMDSARGFTLEQLRDAVRICAETDEAMKSSGGDGRDLMKNAVLSIAVESADAKR